MSVPHPDPLASASPINSDSRHSGSDPCRRCGATTHRTDACHCIDGCCTPWLVAGSGQIVGDTHKSIWWRLAVSLLLAGQGMLVGLAVNITPPPADLKFLVQFLVGMSSLAVFLLLGGSLVQGMMIAIRHRRIGIESMFLLTMSGAALASLQALFTGRGPIYFEVISILLCVYTVNRLIGVRTKATARNAAERWSQRLHWVRRVGQSGEAERVAVDQIAIGDLIEVHPGEWIPIDGVIEAGQAFVRDTPLTGEPFSRTRRPGEHVLAGFAVEDSTLKIRATSTGLDRKINALLAAVGNSQQTPLRLQAQAEQLMGFFLPLVVSISVATFAFWTFQSGWETGLFHAMSVLLIACPCALGLATPIAVWSALGSLAEQGLILRRADAIERLAEVDHVVFDKTGTLTDDQQTVIDIVTASGVSRQQFLGWLAGIESRIQHPLARSLARVSEGHTEVMADVVLETIPGCGIHAEFRDTNGHTHRLRAGQIDWLQQEFPNDCAGLRAMLSAETGQEILVELDGQLAGIVLLRERVRDAVAETLNAFQRMLLPVSVLSGDRVERVQTLGIPDAVGEMQPLEKQHCIDRWQESGEHCLFVGDGMNDAPALISAHSAIALSSGMDLALAAAPATLFHGDLRTIPWAILHCRHAVRLIRSNIRFAAAYNTLGMGLAASGLLEPITAATLMVLASLTVGWRASSVLRFPRNLQTIPGMRTAKAAVDLPTATELTGRSLGVSMQSLFHWVAWTCQGVLLSMLSGLYVHWWPAVAGLFGLIGLPVVFWWRQRPRMPHEWDMAFGMLTLGNLGMLTGVWLDSLRRPEVSDICDARWLLDQTSQPHLFPIGSLVGMLLAAWIARRWLTHRPCPGPVWRRHLITFTEQVAMVFGMFVASGLVASLGLSTQIGRVGVSCGAMLVGMLGGMLLSRAAIVALETMWIWLSGGPESDEFAPVRIPPKATSPAG